MGVRWRRSREEESFWARCSWMARKASLIRLIESMSQSAWNFVTSCCTTDLGSSKEGCCTGEALDINGSTTGSREGVFRAKTLDFLYYFLSIF